MRRELGALFLGAAILESCSTTPDPSAIQNIEIDHIVDCQTNPLDDGFKVYTLRRGEIIRVGGITKDGKEDVVSIRAVGDGSFEFNPENNTFTGPPLGPGEMQIEDDNILVIAAAVLDGDRTKMIVSITCIDALPETPQGPQA